MSGRPRIWGVRGCNLNIDDGCLEKIWREIEGEKELSGAGGGRARVGFKAGILKLGLG